MVPYRFRSVLLSATMISASLWAGMAQAQRVAARLGGRCGCLLSELPMMECCDRREDVESSPRGLRAWVLLIDCARERDETGLRDTVAVAMALVVDVVVWVDSGSTEDLVTAVLRASREASRWREPGCGVPFLEPAGDCGTSSLDWELPILAARPRTAGGEHNELMQFVYEWFTEHMVSVICNLVSSVTAL